jgi:hypothetical protein
MIPIDGFGPVDAVQPELLPSSLFDPTEHSASAGSKLRRIIDVLVDSAGQINFVAAGFFSDGTAARVTDVAVIALIAINSRYF